MDPCAGAHEGPGRHRNARFDAYRRCLSVEDPETSPVVAGYILMKLAARRNLACTYCYWFRDETVMAARSA